MNSNGFFFSYCSINIVMFCLKTALVELWCFLSPWLMLVNNWNQSILIFALIPRCQKGLYKVHHSIVVVYLDFCVTSTFTLQQERGLSARSLHVSVFLVYSNLLCIVQKHACWINQPTYPKLPLNLSVRSWFTSSTVCICSALWQSGVHWPLGLSTSPFLTLQGWGGYRYWMHVTPVWGFSKLSEPN